MMIEDEYIRLIFGLKLKQIRTENNLSLFGLAKLSGLSKSYLNEIEKGKKYPKTDKILILSEKLEVSYDHLVSLKLDKNLAPIGEILQSKILKEIPLELFGIKENNLIDIVANAHAQVNSWVAPFPLLLMVPTFDSFPFCIGGFFSGVPMGRVGHSVWLSAMHELIELKVVVIVFFKIAFK